jgi:hypothetical protein
MGFRMSQIPPRPQYAAALFEDDALEIELAPISISDALNDHDAIEFAMDRAGEWAVSNGVDRAWVKVVRDGVGLSPLLMTVGK